MVQIPESKITSKGRLGPGQLIAVNLKKGKIYRDKDIKDFLSKDYKKFHKQIVHLDKKIISEKEFANFSSENLRRRQYLSGYSIEDPELILHPMVEDAKEATGINGR